MSGLLGGVQVLPGRAIEVRVLPALLKVLFLTPAFASCFFEHRHRSRQLFLDPSFVAPRTAVFPESAIVRVKLMIIRLT